MISPNPELERMLCKNTNKIVSESVHPFTTLDDCVKYLKELKKQREIGKSEKVKNGIEQGKVLKKLKDLKN